LHYDFALTSAHLNAAWWAKETFFKPI